VIINPYIYTYQTICETSGKSYIGVHSTKKINDGYIGCGIYRDSNATMHYLFHRAVKKYGYASFKKHILCFFDNYEDALKEERYLVNEKWVLDKNNYNTALGGKFGNFMFAIPIEIKKRIHKKISKSMMGRIVSQETKDKISKTHTGVKLSENHIASLKANSARYWAGKKRSQNVIDAIRKSKIGKKLSEDHRKKLSESHKGQESEKKITILQYNLNGIFLKEYNSITDAAKSLNCLKTSINNNLKKRTKTCNGFVFKYKKEVVIGYK
jgi:hypothetical protein